MENNSELDDLSIFWFSHPELWFNSTSDNDKLITIKFGSLINNNPDIQGIILRSDKNELLQNILLYDQIIRHVFRNNSDKITELSRFSLELSRYILDHNLDYQYLPQERCFILMPLRHTFDLKLLDIVLDKIKEYREELDSSYYIRFYKATILAMSKVKTPLIIPEEINESISNTDIFNSLDPHCVKNLDIITDINKSEPIYKAFVDTLRKMKGIKEITLSLSGGADSMVSSLNLYHISKNQTKFKINAVTIDYGNREDNKYEVEFVKRWCRLLGITHYVKHITELKRNRSMDRAIYEKLTRTMRFDMYRRFGNPVILGHNLDDCLENVFNNIKKTRSLNNLRGMTEFGEEEGCQIVRPMLNIPKQDIKAFAYKYMIPHLPNSTHSWSERGRIRDELIPSINHFDIALIPGMIKLADNMKQMYDIYNISIVQRFYDSMIEFSESNVLIHLPADAPEKQYGFIFWKDIICRILKRLELSLPSNKSMKASTLRIAHNQYGKIKVSNIVTFYYTSSNLILQLKNN
jgi:tRNA(Ile)-lysidine synthetase-like protein